ncbi:MAG TPA: tRNA 2-thiouridine(34) synthase MnmA [Candidatus Binatia bacterium]|jgi:tRNA-specific 2-thiouridylase
MTNRKEKVVVAMSGGVDSSVAAGLLLEQGCDVEGVSLRMWEGESGPRVCSDHRGAEDIAALLGIPHTLLDLRSEFARTVVRSFASDYLHGRTPNPCVACNRDFKLGVLLEWARKHDARYVATGHYAKIFRSPDGRNSLYRGADRSKDQSYFLFALSQEQLAQTLFPVGELSKAEVREHARRFGLPNADRQESQDICFGDYKNLVESVAGREQVAGGTIVARSGAVLGRHNGIHHFTIGQRRGLGVATGQPLYVTEIEEASRQVVVGTRAELGCTGFFARNLNWLVPFTDEESEAEVQIRYRSRPVPAVLRRIDDESSIQVAFREPVPAVTPGQAAVFYRGDRVLGGGWIERALREPTGNRREATV